MMVVFYLPGYVKTILNTLRNAGAEAYVVGGAVRDSLLGRQVQDYDIATSAPPRRIKELFAKTCDTGIRYGTVTVLMDGHSCEVTMFRRDMDYEDSRRPSAVEEAEGIEQDLQRRDFTVNAMAYNPEEGRVIDPFGGRRDLAQGLIRCVGDPYVRFEEDALRMLRAFRFCAVYGFTVERETLNAISRLRHKAAVLSAERVQAELVKMLCAVHTGTLTLLLKCGLMEPYICRAAELSDLSALPAELPVRLAAFLFLLEITDVSVLRQLKFDKRTIKICGHVLDILYRPPAGRTELKRCMAGKDITAVEAALTVLEILSGQAGLLEEMRDILFRGECYTIPMLEIGGRDLLELGLGGPQIGDALHLALDAVVSGQIENERQVLLDFIHNRGAQ